MSNLLPPQSQKSVWNATLASFLGVSSSVLLASAALSALALLPGYLVLAYAIPGALSVAKTQSNATSTADVIATQSVIKTILPVVAATTTPDTVMIQIANAKPKGIHINRFGYLAGKTQTITVSGIAHDGDALNAFRTALVAANIGAVSVPVGALIGTADGQFTISIFY